MQATFQFLATLCGAIVCGASVYVSFVEHPARMECGTELAATEFAPSYHRAAIMQPTLAASGLLFSVLAWLFGAGLRWLIGGVLLGLVIPFTVVAILPTNRRLLARDVDKSSAETRELLLLWGRLHAVRTVLSLLALVVFLTNT